MKTLLIFICIYAVVKIITAIMRSHQKISLKDNQALSRKEKNGIWIHQDDGIRITVSSNVFDDFDSYDEPDDYEWISHNCSINIAGYEISEGMLYVGKHLNCSKGYGFSNEPSLINPELPIRRSNPDFEGRQMSYWPSYQNIHPECRAAYLEWLKEGRKNSSINIGYVFLFFYGLEHRIIHDSNLQKIEDKEVLQIMNEVKRLRKIYSSSSNSFNGYSTNFINLIQIKRAKGKFYEQTPPEWSNLYDTPAIIKLALGQLTMEEKPLPFDWIFSWVKNSSWINLRTPARRCNIEFKELFFIKYREKYGEGIKLKPCKNKVKVYYHAASGGFRGSNEIEVPDICDITELKTFHNKIIPFVEECQEELDSYSRWLGKNATETKSLAAISLLPKELIKSDTSSILLDFVRWLDSLFITSKFAVVNNKVLISKWPTKNDESMNRSESQSFSSLLEKLGFGIEPDIRKGGPNIKNSMKSVIFRVLDGDFAINSEKFGRLKLLLRLAVIIAKSDGEILEQELLLIRNNFTQKEKLATCEIRRLEAYIIWLIDSDLLITGLKKNIDELESSQKEDFAKYLLVIAGVDGFISPDEIKILTQFYTLLGFDPNKLYSDIHNFMVVSDTMIDEPITVLKADPGKINYNIPENIQQGVQLNPELIDAKIKETEEVRSILSSIFGESSEPEDDNERNLLDLDEKYFAVMSLLKEKNIWQRNEFEALVEKYDILPDGLIDLLNEKSLEFFDEMLCEGDDPLEINLEILKELLN